MANENMLEKLETRIQDNPNSLVFAHLADLYLGGNKLEEAIALCQEGIKNNPDYLTGYFVLAKAFIQREAFDQAEKALKKVLSHDNEFLAAHRLLGDLMIKMGFKNKAAQHYKEILRLDPLDTSIKSVISSLGVTDIDQPEEEPPNIIDETPKTATPEEDWSADIHEVFPDTEDAEALSDEEKQTPGKTPESLDASIPTQQELDDIFGEFSTPESEADQKIENQKDSGSLEESIAESIKEVPSEELKETGADIPETPAFFNVEGEDTDESELRDTTAVENPEEAETELPDQADEEEPEEKTEVPGDTITESVAEEGMQPTTDENHEAITEEIPDTQNEDTASTEAPPLPSEDDDSGEEENWEDAFTFETIDDESTTVSDIQESDIQDTLQTEPREAQTLSDSDILELAEEEAGESETDSFSGEKEKSSEEEAEVTLVSETAEEDMWTLDVADSAPSEQTDSEDAETDELEDVFDSFDTTETKTSEEKPAEIQLKDVQSEPEDSEILAENEASEETTEMASAVPEESQDTVNLDLDIQENEEPTIEPAVQPEEETPAAEDMPAEPEGDLDSAADMDFGTMTPDTDTEIPAEISQTEEAPVTSQNELELPPESDDTPAITADTQEESDPEDQAGGFDQFNLPSEETIAEAEPETDQEETAAEDTQQTPTESAEPTQATEQPEQEQAPQVIQEKSAPAEKDEAPSHLSEPGTNETSAKETESIADAFQEGIEAEPESPPQPAEKPIEEEPKKEPAEEEGPKKRIVTPTLGEIYAAQGQYDKAIKIYEELLEQNPREIKYRQKLDELIQKQKEAE